MSTLLAVLHLVLHLAVFVTFLVGLVVIGLATLTWLWPGPSPRGQLDVTRPHGSVSVTARRVRRPRHSPPDGSHEALP